MNKNRKKLMKAALITAGTAGLIYGINRLVFKISTMNELLKTDKQAYYSWRFGNIYYTKKGAGSPVLLIHNLDTFGSGYEWKKTAEILAGEHTVYVIDLPGCGRSDKDKIVYTNYLYVQAIQDFIRTVIGEKTDIITSGVSSSIAIMAAKNDPELYGRIIMINPESLDRMIQNPNGINKAGKMLLELPLIGTLAYVIASSQAVLRKKFKDEYFYDSNKIEPGTIEAFHEAAHLGGFGARFAFASQVGYYTRINIVQALKTLDNSMYIICGEDYKEKDKITDGYVHFNSAIETGTVMEAKGMPHMEMPEETASMCALYLND